MSLRSKHDAANPRGWRWILHKQITFQNRNRDALALSRALRELPVPRLLQDISQAKGHLSFFLVMSWGRKNLS